jgi:hypothetical protein
VGPSTGLAIYVRCSQCDKMLIEAAVADSSEPGKRNILARISMGAITAAVVVPMALLCYARLRQTPASGEGGLGLLVVGIMWIRAWAGIASVAAVAAFALTFRGYDGRWLAVVALLIGGGLFWLTSISF